MFCFSFIFIYLAAWGLSRGHSHFLVVSCRLSCSAACGNLVPQPGIKLGSSALPDGLFTTRPRGKSPPSFFYSLLCFSWMQYNVWLNRVTSVAASTAIVVWPWTGHFITLSLRVLIHEIRMFKYLKNSPLDWEGCDTSIAYASQPKPRPEPMHPNWRK